MWPEAADQCVPSLEWIGLKITDLSIFEFNSKSLLQNLNESDKRISKSLLEKLFLTKEFDLIKQVKKANANFKILKY